MGTDDKNNRDQQKGNFKPGQELFQYQENKTVRKDQNR